MGERDEEDTSAWPRSHVLLESKTFTSDDMPCTTPFSSVMGIGSIQFLFELWDRVIWHGFGTLG